MLAILSGLGEELFFRAAMQPSLGLLPTSLLFALLHLQPGRGPGAWSLFALAAGLLLGLLTLQTGNILAATVAHILVNWVNLRRLASTSRGSERP